MITIKGTQKPIKRKGRQTNKNETRNTETVRRNAKNENDPLTGALTVGKPKKLLTINLQTEEKEIDKHLQNIRSILLNSNATPIRSHRGQGYLCCFCIQYFAAAKDLKIHTLEKHDDSEKRNFMRGFPFKCYIVKLDITGLICKVCNQNIETVDQILDHLKTKHNETIYTDIKSHIVPFKFEGDTLDCVYCPQKYARFKMLQEHMNFHFSNYVCELCNAPFVNKRTLQGHMLRHKQGEFSCSFCSKVFDTRTKKCNHEKFVHSGDQRRNKCSFCTEKFSSYALKNEHMVKEHGVEPVLLTCLACDKTFTRKDRLNLHVKRDHLMERNYECDHCGKRFYEKKELNMHMLKHTGIKQHVCDVCLKAFGRKHTLKEHLRIHADDRRFKCEHCGLAFVQKCSWKSHLRSKHGDHVNYPNRP